MSFIFEPEYKKLFQGNMKDIYENFKSNKAAEVFEAMGEWIIASKLRGRAWTEFEKDAEFITEIMKASGVLKEPSIVFNEGINEENHEYLPEEGFKSSGSLNIENKNSGSFELAIKKVYPSSEFFKVQQIRYDNQGASRIISIDYTLELPKSYSQDHVERIIVLTNYRTYVYRISLQCRQGVEFSQSLSFRSMKEFFQLYERDYEAASEAFGSPRFLDWLQDNKLKLEEEHYRSFRASSSSRQGLQSFLQILGFDVMPELSVKFIEDTLTIKNLGKGYLYGTLECVGKIEADRSKWEQDMDNNELNIVCRGNGTLKIVSNAGCAIVSADAAQNKLIPCTTEVLEFDMSLLKKSSVKLEGLYDIPRLSCDNHYVNCYLDSNYDIVIERNLGWKSLIRGQMNKIPLTSNIKVSYPEKIYHIKVRLN